MVISAYHGTVLVLISFTISGKGAVVDELPILNFSASHDWAYDVKDDR